MRGCMPAKTLLAATQYEGEVAKAHEVGVETGAMHVDLPAIVRRKRHLVDYFAEDRVEELKRYPLARGNARFVAPDAVVVGAGRHITADRFIIATGAEGALPANIDGIGEITAITSADVLEMTTLPRSVAVLGGGPIGCAFAQYFARLGSRVTLLQDGLELLRNEDPDVGTAVRAALERDGVKIASVLRHGNIARVYEFARAHGEYFIAMEHVDGLDLARGRIEGDRARGIVVDATLRSVSNPRVFAAGDVLGRRSLVHAAVYGGKLAAANAFAAQPVAADWPRWETHALYTSPQVAVAGRTERECRAERIAVDVAYVPASEVGEALVADEAEGFVKMLVRRDDGRVAGITLVLDDAVDLAGEAIALVDRGATAAEIAGMPHLHPTMSELLARVAEKFPAPVARGSGT